MNLKTQVLALAASAAMIVPAMAADIAPLEPMVFEEMHEGKPAVSGLNGKLEVGFDYTEYDLGLPLNDGDVHARSVYGIGSLSAPLGQQFGIQVDAGISQSFDDEVFFGAGRVDHSAYGIGAHLFWRDPDTALIGLYGHYLRVDRTTTVAIFPFERKTDVFRIAAAGEYYMGDFSLEGHVGADFLSTELSLGVIPITATERATFLNARAVGAYYPTDNARIFAGAKYAFEEFAGVAGAEYMFASDNPVAPALFVEGSLGEDSASINAGLRVYFGPSGKSLKARHREDDPRAQLFDDMPAIGGCSSTVDLSYAIPEFGGDREGPVTSPSTCGLANDPLPLPRENLEVVTGPDVD